MRVWFAHAKREYGSARAEAGREAIRRLHPGCTLIDPEWQRWGPGFFEQALPGLDLVAYLPCPPVDALGVREEVGRAQAVGKAVLDLSPYVLEKLALAPVGVRIPPAVQTVCAYDHGYTFGIWRWYPLPPPVAVKWLFSPVGDGASYVLRAYLGGGELLLEWSGHVGQGDAVEGGTTGDGQTYHLQVTGDRGWTHTEEGAIGTVPVVHEWGE